MTYNRSTRLRTAVEPGDGQLETYDRARLGDGGSSEIIHVVEQHPGKRRPAVLLRGRESTSAQDWADGSAFRWIPADEADPLEPARYLGSAITAGDTLLDTNGMYYRIKIGSEIMHVLDVLGGTPGRGDVLTVTRAAESTAEADHASGSAVAWLEPGES